MINAWVVGHSIMLIVKLQRYNMVTRVADDIEWSCMIIMDGGEMEYM